MLIEFRNGRRKEVKDAAARYMIKIGTAKRVMEEQIANRSMADKPKVQKVADASEIFNTIEDFDSEGKVWSPDLHTASKIKNQDGTWRKKPGARAAVESDE